MNRQRGVKAGRSIIAPLLALLLACGSFACDEDRAVTVDSNRSPVDAGVVQCADAAQADWRVQTLGKAASIDGSTQLALFYDVWGAATDAIFAVGRFGKVAFYDGTEWSSQETPTDRDLTSVWGTSATDVWAVGHEGTLLHYDGAQWTAQDPPDDAFVSDDAGVPQGDAAVGLRRNLWGVWAWGSEENGTEALYAVGDQGFVLHLDTTTNLWTGNIPVTNGSNTIYVMDQLNSVWGTGRDKIYVVGHFGTILVGSKDQLAKQAIDPPTQKDLLSVWGRGSDDIYAVGNGGTIVQYRSGSWRQITGAPKQVLRDVWGPANDRSITYVVGWDGTLLQMSGGPGFSKGAVFDAWNCVAPMWRLEAIWGTLVEGALPDAGTSAEAGVPDMGIPMVPAAWIVGASGTVITGP